MYLLDTDICSYAMQRRHAAMIDRIRSFAPGELKVSVITQFKLEYGARRSRRSNDLMAIIEAFCSNVEILPFGFAAARQSARVRAELTAAGRPIGQYDMLIAGHARALGAVLVTNNTAEFRRVDALQIENWAT